MRIFSAQISENFLLKYWIVAKNWYYEKYIKDLKYLKRIMNVSHNQFGLAYKIQ